MRALGQAGIDAPFPIQAATIADAMAGSDVLGKARTGSGKTLGFGLPTIARLADAGRVRAHRPQAVVLVPTRELAIQVHDALEPLAHTMDVTLKLVAGGLSMPKQIASLERGVQLVIATPGRLADLVRRGHADMSSAQIVVLDEADHMAEMGFMTEIEEVLADVPDDAQHLLFSATLDGDVDRIIAEHMHDPVLHDVTGDDGGADMRHVVLNVAPHLKYEVATRIAARHGRTIVFVRTKLACDRIAEQMRDAGVSAVALHGDKEQHERNTAIDAFRSGRVPVLVATDVAARGIHVEDVDLVLQLDPPSDVKDYTHRAGRTARAGAAGLVVTLALPHQRKTMDRIVDATGIDPLFRKVRDTDGETLDMIDSLTGGREPSREPVKEPKAGRAPRDERDERGGRGGQRDSRGGRGAASRDGRPGPGGRSGKRSGHRSDDRADRRAPDRSGGRSGGRPSEQARGRRDDAGRPARSGDRSRDGGRSGSRDRNGSSTRDERWSDAPRGRASGRPDTRDSRGGDRRPARRVDDRPGSTSRRDAPQGSPASAKGSSRETEPETPVRRERQANPNPRKKGKVGSKSKGKATKPARKGKPRPKKKR